MIVMLEFQKTFCKTRTSCLEKNIHTKSIVIKTRHIHETESIPYGCTAA